MNAVSLVTAPKKKKKKINPSKHTTNENPEINVSLCFKDMKEGEMIPMILIFIVIQE